MSPVQEKDVWSQLILEKKDIAKNTKAMATLLKKNWFNGVYEKYLAIISGGYIYFYKSSEDDEYNGYYYLKDSEVKSSLDSLIILLSNDSGSIELKFPNENKFKVYISDLTVLNIDYYNRISTTDTRLIRRIVRDNNFRNYDALHTLNMWYSVNRGEQRNIFPYQEQADCMFNSSIVYEIAALKKYAVPLLQEIKSDEPAYSEAKRLLALFQYFEDMDDSLIPNNSLIREFIGGSIFED